MTAIAFHPGARAGGHNHGTCYNREHSDLDIMARSHGVARSSAYFNQRILWCDTSFGCESNSHARGNYWHRTLHGWRCDGVRVPGPSPPESASTDLDDSHTPYDTSCGHLDYGDYDDDGDDAFDAYDQEYGFGGDWYSRLKAQASCISRPYLS